MAKAKRRGPTLIQQSRRVPSGQKALYHQVVGAGKSRVLRPFFDLNAEDLVVLAAEADRRLGQRLTAR